MYVNSLAAISVNSLKTERHFLAVLDKLVCSY